MNSNVLSTAALLAIAIALFIQAGMMWEPPAQEIHFRAIMKYCEELPSVTAQGPEGYFKCVAELAPR
jgi:hypothetical protein